MTNPNPAMDDTIRQWYSFLQNTGGNDAEALIDLVKEFYASGEILIETNLPRYLIAFAIISQVNLIRLFTSNAMLTDSGRNQQWQRMQSKGKATPSTTPEMDGRHSASPDLGKISSTLAPE